MKYKLFKVRRREHGWVTFEPISAGGHILAEFLPSEVNAALPVPGIYVIQRVGKGDLAVGLVPSAKPRFHPGRYGETGGLLCKHLCRLLGYACKRKQTIRVSIKPVSA